MGCSPSKSSSFHDSIVKLDDFNRRTVHSLNISPLSAGQKASCLKIQIKAENVEQWEFYNALIKRYADKVSEACELVYKTYTNYHALFSQFENLIHAACIPAYTFKKGIEFVVFYCKLTKNCQIAPKKSEALPYFNDLFKVHLEENEISVVWDRIIAFLRDFNEKNGLEAAVRDINDYASQLISDNFSLPTGKASLIKVLTKYMTLAGEAKALILNALHDFKYLTDNIQGVMKKVNSLVTEYKDMNDLGTVEIVHSIYS